MLTNLGKFLRIMRINRSEILKDMADKLEVSPAFLSAIENGKKKIPTSMRNLLIKKYKLAKDEIYKLDKAIEQSNDTVEINIASLSNENKDLAISFARSFDTFSDKEFKILADFINNRNKGNK